eukprot:scaffold228919_cov31-Tisochrysis_lutea.AAC.4
MCSRKPRIQMREAGKRKGTASSKWLEVRGAVVELMESWASVAGMDTPVSELLEVLHSPKCTGDGKADGIGWLAKRVGVQHYQGGAVAL